MWKFRLRATEFEIYQRLNKIGKPVGRGEGGRMSPPTVNAYFSSQRNDIHFPAGVIRSERKAST